MSVNDEWEKALNGYANIKWNPKQKQPKSPVGGVKKSDERYEPLVGGLINGLNGLERTAYQALGGINAQLAGWSANQQTRHTGDIERYKQSYENNPVLRKTAMTPEEYEKRRLENPSFWGQVLGGVDQKTKFTKEQAEELRQKWMLEEEKPWMDKANAVEDVRYTRMPANALEKVGVDLATNAPQLGEAALSGAALGSVLGPAGSALGAGLSMAKNIYGAAYGDERRKGRSIDASHGAAVADTLYQMPFEYVGASRIFKAIPGLRRAFGKLSPQGKSKFGEWLKTVRTEGSTEFLQQYGDSSADDIADAIETGKFQQDFEAGAKVMGDIAYENAFGENAGKNLEEAAYAGLLGGIMGGATHGAGMAIDALGRKLAGNPNITQADLEQAVDEAGQDIAQDGDSSFGNDALNFLANQTDVQLTEGQARNLAAAMAGNAFQESGYDSTVENGIGAYGSFQHLGDRKDALFNFAEENGLDPSSRQAQIAFAWKEMMTEGTLENQAFQEIMALGDNQPEAAAVIYRKLFERPGEEEANDEARMAEARRVHDRAAKAREWLTNKRDMMDMDRADADSVCDTINQILTESTDEQLLEQAKAFGFREEQEKDVNDQRQRAEQSIEQNAPQETPKATPQPQGQAGQLALIQTENTQAPQAQQQPVQGMETVNKDRTAPHIDRNKANKGNFNNRGNYNGRLDAPQNKRVESPIRNQGQSAPILQQGENQNAENLQTQTTERRENRENLNENTQPQQTQTAENQATPQNPQGNEVTPTLAPSNQGTAGIAQSTPKIASNGQNEITSKVNGKALVKATEGNTRVVSGESENVGEQGIKGDIALDRDGTVSAFKKAVNGILAKLKAGNVSQTRQKLTEARSKAIIRIAERKNNKEISEEMEDRLENRIDEIVTEAKETLNKASNDMLKDAFGMGRGIPSIFNKDAVEKIASNKKVKDIVDKMPKAEEEKQSKKAENNSEAKRETKDDGKKDKNPNKEETAEAKKPSQKEEKFTNETVDKKDTEKAKTIEKEEAKAPQEKPKKTKAQQKADAEKEIKTQIETLATQLNNLARKIENNDIMKEDNSNVSNKEESENVPERSAGLSGTVGMGESRSSEGEGTRNENTVEGNSKDEGGNSGRELREKSSSNAGTDEGKTERSVSDTPTERVGNGRDDSARNESGGIEPTVKVENVEKDIAVGKVKNARDTSGNDYIPTKAETENRSPKKRCEANIDAIAVLKKLETENRKATPTEQEILAGYSGWGGLSFAFDERSSSYSPETNQKLRDLLTETEYAEAKSEIISAFYTPPFVIQAMWKLANRLGFKGGRVLDPSCGVANFFTYMPTEMKGNSTALQGIDKSPIPARIAAQLFQSQKYKVDNSSYEKFARGDNFYDLAITNVPFSSSIYPVDKAVKGSYNLQDYYFAKSLQKVRPGGLIIFMTTHSTMDGTSSWQIRRELSLKTELLGAIRLPSNLFDKAGAGVISDIVVLRKLNEGEGVNKESWGNYAKKKDKKGFEVNDTEYWKAADEAGGWKRVNNYWNEHPENVVGKVETTKGRYGGKDIVVKTENEAETQKLLDDAVNRFAENVYQPRVAKPLNTVERVTETVDPSVRYVGDIYENSDGQWVKAVFDKDVGRITGEVFPTSKQAQVGAFMAINKAQNDLMIAEVTPETTDKDLTEKRKALNTAYDKYLAKYGALNEKSTLSLVDEFPQIGRMLALENYTPPASKKRGAKGTIKKAEIFTKRVLYPEGINVKVETPEDALIASIQKFGRIDLEYMGNAIGSTQADLVSNLSDKIIKDPLDERYVLLDEYLSGNVRAKLLIAENAAETDPDMKRNVELLKKVVPKDVEITDISIPLGSPVVTQEETQEFVDHMLGVRDAVTVKFNPVAGIWDVKRGSRNGYLTHQTDYIDYGVYIDSRNRADSAKLIEACLNTTDISNWGMFKVGEEDSAEMRKAREEAQQQAQLIREKIDREFKQWIEANAEVSARVKEAYNLKFNAFAPRKYDGSILSVNTTKHTPYAHQLNGALRAIMSKATLLNHCVGSGKSLTMMIAGMEMKRMGLANKIVYALPKNVVKQFEKEFYEDFPTAKILVLSSETLPRAPRTITYDLVPKYDIDGKTQLKDDDGVLIYEKKPVTKEEEARRRAILARRNATLQKIKTNDWDAILVSHNTFENIPVSDDVLIDFYQKEIKRYEDALEQEEFEKTRRSDRKGRTARRIQELLEKYRNMLTEALEGKEKYDVGMDTFETLGIDQIFVDESDLFKNLGFLTSLSQVKGVSTTGSGRAMDMFLKTQYLLHEPSAHGVVFATGTPISNSISEAYTLCRYLAPDELERLGCNSFDQFAKLFVNIAPAEEPKLDGSGYQYKTKVVGIRNAPECFRMINQFMDTKTVEDLPYIKERLPKARRTTITVKEPAVLSKFKGGLASRIKGFKGKFGKELPLIESRSRASIEHFKETGEYLKVRDGYLKVAQDYKDITLCPYIYDSTLTGEEAFGRVWACADKAAEVYKKTTETKGTQVIFCDSSTPKKGEWSVYEELKQRLIAQGIPENEIAFVHDAGNNEAKRQEIFNAVRDGRIRILIGSTEKMGAGTNMQDRLVALHHLDAPWRPRDIEQREGRILRNGNKNKEVDIFTYVTEGSYDMNLYNLLSTKQSVFSQILHGSEDVRETDTEGVDNNNFAEIEKLANNDPTQVMYLEKQQQLRRLEAEKAGDVAAKTHAAFVVNSYGEKIARDEADLADSKKDVAEAEKIGDKFTIEILGDIYTDREKATDAFKKALQDVVKTLATEFSKETLSGRYANIADVYVQPIPIAKIGSFDISVGISQYFANNHDENNTELIIQGAVRYGYGTVSAVGAWNAIHSLPTMVKEDAEANLALDQKELEQAHATLDRKFDKDGEIEKLKKEVADLRDAINKAGGKSFSTETDDVKALTKTVQAVYEQDLTDREKGLIAFGRKMGVTVSFFTGDSRLHGWQNGDAIFLNRDMTRDVNQVFWHETFHWLKRNNPKLYEALEKAVLQNDDIAAQVKAWQEKTGRTNLTEEEAIEEMLADAMLDASTRGKFFETLGITHPTLVQKLIKWIRNTYRALVDQFRHTEGFKPEAGLTNTQIDRMSKELDKIADKLVDGNGNKLFEETTAQDDGVKYSVDFSDLSKGKVLNDAIKNAMASRVQEKMEIMKESDAAHYLGKYIPKQPKARPNVSYDTNYGKKKRDKAWELLNYGVLAYIRSPSRLANPIIKQIYTWAEDAKRTQNKFYSKWTEKHKEILDLVQDAKDYAGYVDVLLTEDSDKRVFSDGELRSLGYSDKVIKAHKKVRDLLQEIRAEVAKIYQAEHVETKNFKSKAEADFWAKNPMFKNVEVKAMNKENGTVWQVKYTTSQYVERTTEVNIQLLDELKRRQQPQGNDPADVYILEWQDHQEEITGATTFTVKYLESRNKLANLDQYIPHFFHEFLVIEVKNGTRRVVGSGTTLNEAVAVANNLAAGSKAQFFIAPKGFAYEDSTQALGIVGDKDLSNLSETLKAELEVSLEEAREAVKGNSHHIFLSALQHRKGAKGWETNMRWVIQHHISNTARYCALEPFKQMAMNLFERRFGSFSDSYSGKVIPDFTKGLINSVLGVPSKAEEITNAILSCLPIFENVPRPSRAVTSSIVGAMAVLKLGVSPAAAFINLTQFVNLQGYIGSEWTLKGMNAAWNLSEADTRLLEELGTREEAGLETVDVSEETELIVGRFSKELKALKAAADKSMVLFTKAESFLRTASILGAYRKALAEGKTERAARAYALEINRNVNFNYGVEDAPRMFRALQGSVVGDMFLQFKKYGFKELEVIGDMLTNKNIPKSQKLMFFGEYFLLGGLFNSIPFQDLILALLGFALDEDDPEAEMKKWLMEFGKDNWAKRQLALIGMYGLGGAAGVDISQRVGFRSLVPEAENPFGVTGSTIAQVANALMNGDPIGMLKSTSPALGNLASAYAGHNTDSKGRVSYTYKDPFERVVRAAGFRTTGEALSVDKQRILNEDRSQREKQRKEAREAYFDNPSVENRRRLKELGYTDTQIKNLKPNDPTLERTDRMRKNLSKREQKEFKEILEW